MVNHLDLPPAEPDVLLTDEQMYDNITRILNEYVSEDEAMRIARRAADILIREGYVTEWGLNEWGLPLYEARFGGAYLYVREGGA